MAIHFMTKGEFDLDVIRTMGVSIKSDTAIGYFGTGLKYAIATLLRNDHIVSLRANGETVQFRTREKEIRGKKFQMIMMDDEQLGFTTDLGKDWEVWQAYRELYSNTMDEAGSVGGVIDPDYDTIFTVEGPKIAEVHAERGKIFLHGDPFLVAEGIEVYHGASQYLYYRGVRVHELPKKTRFTYNYTVAMKLTEDRTLASVYDANYKLQTRLPKLADPAFFKKILDPRVDVYEGELDYTDCYDPSEEFLDALESYANDAALSERNRSILKKKRNVNEFTEFTPTGDDVDIIREACEMIKVLNCEVKPADLTFVEHLGANVYAMVKDGKMYFSRQCLAQGRDFLAITIFEEWIHSKLGYADKTRGMQQYLFDKILELIKRNEEE